MLGLTATHFPRTPTLTTKLFLSELPHTEHLLHFPKSTRTARSLVVALANKNDNELKKDPTPSQREENDGPPDSESGKENGRSILSGIRWRDLLVSPDPDNILAVGLTGLLTWASVQVLWQLLFISLAILVAAVKYSLIAALLIFILITLL
ncbi:Transmembrane protein [Parasponia andersonii]|uniref:Transmembrane protein n=1 Tax=Parasponia andersonii TaxID=3476 RepID=A0A2P5ACE7_PARAD|nr:Transmembrane protein [Parasponia andersonii]